MKEAGTLIGDLRKATGPLHDRLEAMTYGDRIMDGSLTPTEYRRLIDWQERVHRGLEPEVANFSYGDYRYRPRFPLAARPGKPIDVARALGILYVLEGASLGGTIIHRKLQDIPALQGEAPFAFYRDQAEWGARQWRSLTKVFSTIDLSEAERQRTIAAAKEAFARFQSEWESMP